LLIATVPALLIADGLLLETTKREDEWRLG
jgi:hypothetical protein